MNQHAKTYRDIYQQGLERFSYWIELNVQQKNRPEALREFFVQASDPQDMRIGWEYLFMNGYYQDLKTLLSRNKHHVNSVNRQWAYLFDLMLTKEKRTLTHDQLLFETQKIKTDDPALKALIEFFVIAIHVDVFDFDAVANRLDDLLALFHQVSHRVLTPLLQYRLDRVLFMHHWKRNEMLLARKYGFRAFKNNHNHVHLANLHINLSLSYLFDDFESANYHLKEAEKMARENDITRIITMIEQQNRPFIYAHFNRPEGLTTPIKSEQAHLAMAGGDYETARQILSEFTEFTPFTHYYLGRAHHDYELLERSYDAFIEERSDHYFARLPLTAMQSM
ncbi:hypothetical protein SAMN05421734_10186 [Pelagirhabdus alkalitolerans]|uniref:Uncharacterized protein n=1 Tax=Pelagirhabdus alkalitolerans TaxID=1612202 RepID=A0A1G6GHL1_9BACI|nr:AimR family lysis-lysogeny pheromone receptor [Pelagirhabdus alkalitolerans]SDB81379.1 hypothetical protein SAMN05421734_10186 [Pelagirhabdus alkalitolerans]